MTVLVPESLEEALDVLARTPDATVLAGGTDAMVEVNFGHRHPRSVVSISRIAALKGWHHDVVESNVRIGAGVTYTELMEQPLATLLPALAEAARTVGSPQIRNAGTIGGNLVTCSPAGDALPVLSALDATIELASAAGQRQLSIHDFMVGVKRTALEPGEIVVAATVPVLAGGQCYAKVGVRNAMVISTASAAIVTDPEARFVNIALGAVGPTIIRARDAESWIADRVDWNGAPVADEVAREFGERVAAEARPIDDHRSTAAYRRHAVSVLARRLLVRALRP
ncbi:MAG: xanthine dehydrogenase family protein subunit M [Acidimicrobiales bacterium]